MRKLVYTTAIVSLGAFGAVAQTAGSGEATAAQSDEMVPGFRVSDFIGADLYAHDSDRVREVHGQSADASTSAPRAERWTSDELFLDARDSWENVGAIDDLVVTGQGQVRGVLVDVGGFLGFGARSVMVDLDRLYFVTDEERAREFGNVFVVAALSREQLEELPEWDEEALETGFEHRAIAPERPETEATSHGTQAAAGDEEGMVGSPRGVAEPPAGYAEVESPPTVDALLEAEVFDAHGESIGRVDDVVIGAEDTATHLVLDIGGFLGVGSHTVALEIVDLHIFQDAESGSVRVHTPMTEAQLESLPEFEGRGEHSP